MEEINAAPEEENGRPVSLIFNLIFRKRLCLVKNKDNRLSVSNLIFFRAAALLIS